jgi:hypothetical protein
MGEQPQYHKTKEWDYLVSNKNDKKEMNGIR